MLWLCNVGKYRKILREFADRVCHDKDIGGKVLVLGTEEFMFPAIHIGAILQDNPSVSRVRVHATTRSPILVSDENEYPLHRRYQLRSCYDEGRTTFVYDLEKYDTVLVVTDSEKSSNKGIQDILAALKLVGNECIRLYNWKR